MIEAIKWNDVTDGTPMPMCGGYLVRLKYLADNKPFVWIAYLDNEGVWRNYFTDPGEPIKSTVTHWAEVEFPNERITDVIIDSLTEAIGKAMRAGYLSTEDEIRSVIETVMEQPIDV